LKNRIRVFAHAEMVCDGLVRRVELFKTARMTIPLFELRRA